MSFLTTNRNNLGSVHQSNLMASLNHRLEVAKASHDQRLVTALELEYAQLTTIAHPVAVRARLERLWVRFAETLSDWSKIHIECTVEDNGKQCWHAYNPQSGQAIVTDSESDMHQWVRANYWGQ